ncbi:hypothetical protein FACS1894188_10910 [Clostridia bacterium]|nr:hypothetical protein FACS1894188_10910 [Clostridia bacterium]
MQTYRNTLNEELKKSEPASTKPSAKSVKPPKPQIAVPAPVAHQYEDDPDDLDEPETIDLEIINQTASAGHGSMLIENYLEPDFHPFPAHLVPRGTTFCVYIQGDSMESEIQDGDIAFIKQSPEVQDGEIGIFIIEGDQFCKKLHVNYTTRTFELLSFNPKFPPIPITNDPEISTIGVVLGTAPPTILTPPTKPNNPNPTKTNQQSN